MSSVSQIIPNFIGGINDQPDELKKPGQVRDAVNMIPDVVKGLYKRPGYEKIEGELPIGNGTWMSMYAEEDNGVDKRYLVFIGELGGVAIYDADTGERKSVQAALGSLDLSKPIETTDLYPPDAPPIFDYFKHDPEEQELRFTTKNDTLWITNPDVGVTMSKGNVNTVRPFEAFVEVTTIDESRAYPINIDFINLNLGAGVRRSRNVVTKMTLDAQVNFSDFDKGDNQGDCTALTGIYNIESIPNDNRPDATPISIRVEVRSNPVAFKEKTRCKYYVYDMTILNGGTGWKKGDVVSFKVKDNSNDPSNHAYVRYEITQIIKQNASIDLSPPAAILDGDNNSVSIIVDQWYNSLKDEPRFSAVEKVGNGLYLASYTEPFIVDTTEKDLINILSSTGELDQDADDDNATVNELYPCPVASVNNVSDLPLECKSGFVCKVANTYSDNDDYYVRFVNNYGYDGSNGQGYWQEIAKPGEDVSLNSYSMPHVIKKGIEYVDTLGNYTRFPDVFAVGPVQWAERTVGTASRFNPSFTENSDAISNVFFYRNRLTLLSKDNVVTSQAGDYANLFPNTALSSSPTDPVDITADTNYSSPLRAGIVVNNAAVIFSEYQQFLLTTDSDVFSPSTAKMSQISKFHFDPRSEPFMLDTNIGFKGGQGDDARLYEMTNIFREGQVDAVERSKLVFNTLSGFADHFNVEVSRDTGTVFMAGKGSDTIFIYKYFKESSQKDLLSAWTRWKLPGDVEFHFTSRDSHYAVVRDGDTSLDILKLTPTNPPIDYFNVDENNANQPTDVEASVELPTIYVVKAEQGAYRADTTASTTIHRVKLNTGDTNYYIASIDRFGKDSYEVEFEQTIMDGYISDESPVTKDREETIQLYERNTSLDITLTSPIGPFQLYSMRWEGDYNSRYYQRV